jgi:predicted O-linked N-acetylglucosamine transferase (SPINDLY family)
LALTSDTAALEGTCGRAMNLQLAGQLDGAAQLYRSILQAQPTHAVANHCLGMLNVQLRRPAEGLPFLLLALTERPEIPDYWLGYLEALLQADQIDAAQEALALGRQHGLSGKAVEEFAARLAAAPRPQSAATAATLTGELTALIGQKRYSEALALARTVTGRFPDDGLGWKKLGALLWWQGLGDEAFTSMQRSVQLLPRDAEAHSNFGMALLRRKRRDDALKYFRRAIEIDRRFAAAHYHAGMMYFEEHRFAEAEASLRVAVALRPDYLTAEIGPVHSDFLFLTSHNPSIAANDLFAEHCRFGELLETPPCESWPLLHSNPRDPERCLRIGFVSGDFRDHSVATFMEPLLTRLAHRPGVELHAYYNHDTEDKVTARLRGYFEHWHFVTAFADIDLAKRITEDRIDILIDLSGHTALNRLRAFALKPAPIQVSWLGYPGTTGLQAMDYYLADRHWLPPGEFDHLFTEKLVYLPDRWAFRPHADAPAVNTLPALETGCLTFGSFHQLGKINASSLRLWSELLLALPQSTLLVVGILDSQQHALSERFVAQGIEPARLRFHDRCSMDRYLALHHQVDIALDTHPYSGATTTMHSLSMGVPTLTIGGSTAPARAGAGILANVGLDGFMAANAADFVAKGSYWANHLTELADVRAGLRTRLSLAPCGQPDLIAAHLEGALRQMWRQWCAALPAESFHSAASDQAAQEFAARPAVVPQPQSGATAATLTDDLTALIAQKRHSEALALARTLTERFPDDGLGWKKLGALLWWQELGDEALIAMQRSVQLLPQDAEAHSNFGMALLRRKRFDDAVKSIERAIEIDPCFAAAHYHLGMMHVVGQRYAEAEASLRVAVSLRPDYLTAEVRPVHSDLLFLTSHNPTVEADALFAEHCRFGELLEAPLLGSWPRHSTPRDPERPLRIGFVSGDFRDHPVGMFLEPVVARLSQRASLELHAYYNHAAEDKVTARLRGQFKHWHPIAALSDVDLAKTITDDRIDILLDLYGHTGLNRLPVFARKPAPIQVSWLGYPGTTGLRAMDYYLADRHWLPPGEFDHLFTEKLVYLPDRWAFKPHADAPAVNTLPALETGRLTFGSFHRLGKINASTLRLWSELLLALPQSTLLLGAVAPGGQQRTLIERFAAHGIESKRLKFHGHCPMDRYLALHHQVDIALDAQPYAGATTTMHSLSMGVPTLTIAGATSMARAGAGILANIGLDGFTAANAADFVAKGIYWANHLTELAGLRAGLRTRLTLAPCGQPDLIAAHLEGALRHMWRQWCAARPAESFHSAASEHGPAPEHGAIPDHNSNAETLA